MASRFLYLCLSLRTASWPLLLYSYLGLRLIGPSRRKLAQPPLKSRRWPGIQEQFPYGPFLKQEGGRCVATLAPQWVSGGLALEVTEVAFRQVTLMQPRGPFPSSVTGPIS